jgi:hypothetical protein
MPAVRCGVGPVAEVESSRRWSGCSRLPMLVPDSLARSPRRGAQSCRNMGVPDSLAHSPRRGAQSWHNTGVPAESAIPTSITRTVRRVLTAAVPTHHRPATQRTRLQQAQDSAHRQPRADGGRRATRDHSRPIARTAAARPGAACPASMGAGQAHAGNSRGNPPPLPGPARIRMPAVPGQPTSRRHASMSRKLPTKARQHAAPSRLCPRRQPAPARRRGSAAPAGPPFASGTRRHPHPAGTRPRLRQASPHTRGAVKRVAREEKAGLRASRLAGD